MRLATKSKVQTPPGIICLLWAKRRKPEVTNGIGKCAVFPIPGAKIQVLIKEEPAWEKYPI